MNSLSENALLLSLAEQCELIQTRRLKSVNLTRSYISRIQQYNPRLNIVIRENFQNALRRADELDNYLDDTGDVAGPLHGVPFTIKDAFRVKNFRTSFGFPGFNCLPSFNHCLVMDRLVSAGAGFIGQTNVPLSCFDWQTISPIYGLTRNPLNPDYTVGGSSGGSAASVAAFFSPFEVGSDVADSIRYPAHCCGIFGLRPTHNFVPFDDIGPILHKRSFANLAVAGPMARSIDDLALVLKVLTNSENVPRAKDLGNHSGL
ncbi:MAG: amidase family protein [Bdellovibrionales bacterium]